MIHYIADKEHYTKVLALCEKVKHDLWIGTADLEDLYEARARDLASFLSMLNKRMKQGVNVRLLHVKEPGENFREDFDKYPGLWIRLERRLCPRGTFQDNDFRLLGGLYRLRQPHWCRHGYERRQQPQLRGRHPLRRTIAGGCRHRPPRQRLARTPLQDLQAQGFLRGQDWIKTFYKTEET